MSSYLVMNVVTIASDGTNSLVHELQVIRRPLGELSVRMLREALADTPTSVAH